MKTNLSTLLIKWIGMLSLPAQAQRDLFHGVGMNTGCASELQERIPNLGVGGLHPDSSPGKVAFIQMVRNIFLPLRTFSDTNVCS